MVHFISDTTYRLQILLVLVPVAPRDKKVSIIQAHQYRGPPRFFFFFFGVYYSNVFTKVTNKACLENEDKVALREIVSIFFLLYFHGKTYLSRAASAVRYTTKKIANFYRFIHYFKTIYFINAKLF